MGLFENFPYANFHELNLDWILHELKELETEITNFVAINSVKYANPIVWDITSQYETNTVVLDSSGNAYLSVQPVPAGVALDREEYWTKIGNFSALWDSVRSAITPYDEQHSTTASVDHKAGDWVWLENNLLLITKNITAGDKYVDGSNCKKTNVHDLFTALSGELQDEITARENGDTTLSQQITKEINDRTTADAGLKTELLKAIADAQQNFIDIKKAGAVGDGVADDTEVFKTVFADGNTTIFIPDGTYKITDTVSFGDNTTVLCSGTIIENITGENYKSAFYGVNKSNIKWIGGKIVGTGALNALVTVSCAILFDHCTDCRLYELEFEDIQNSYVVCFKSSTDCYCERCKINKYTRTGIGALNACNNVYFTENIILECVNLTEINTYPLSLSLFDSVLSPGTAMGKNLNACRNYIYNTRAWWEAIDAHGGEDILIDGNTCIGCRDGIAAFSDNELNFSIKNLRVVNNYVELGTNPADYANKQNVCASVSGSGLVVANNTFKNGNILRASYSTDYSSMIYGLFIENGIIANNNILNGIGAVFVLSTCNNLQICNNTIADCQGISNTYSREIFNFRLSTNNKNIICYNNKGFNLSNFDDVVTNDNNTREQYIKVVDNDLPGVTVVNGLNVVKKMLDPTGFVKCGHVGDIITRNPPQSGQPFGWICTTEWVNGQGGVWTALPNI